MTMINFKIPHRLTRLNEYIKAERGGKLKDGRFYSGKWKAAKIKRDMTTLCCLSIPNESIDYPIEIEMIWTVKRLSNDLDNVAFGKKFILDAMVQKGLIKNDNLTVIKKLSDRYIKGDNEGVEVIIKKYEEV